MDIIDIKEAIKRSLLMVVHELGFEIESERVSVVPTKDLSHGDYASNIAMIAYPSEQDKFNDERKSDEKLEKRKQIFLTKNAGGSSTSNALELSKNIVNKIQEGGKIVGVQKVDFAFPGFINFTLEPEAISAELQLARTDESWGSNQSLSGKVIMLEYTSPNLFKPLHIGNLVGNILGESLARLMSVSGAIVKRINYPSDIGLTVAKGVWGLIRTSGDPKDIKALGEAYRAGNDGYENDPAAKAEIDAINKKLYEDSDPDLTMLRKTGIETSRNHLNAICAQLGTAFDTEIFESEAGPLGRDIVMSHTKDEVFEKSDGAIIFPGEKYGLHTRVFINSAGLPTYEAKDVGNFELKQRAYPEWSQSFVVTGQEQQEYFKVVIAAIKKIFPDVKDKKIVHIPTGFLTLTTGKMSSRKGNVLTGESLLADLGESAKERATESRSDDKERLAQDIAVAAIKYEILKQSSGKNITFDRERALSLEGDSGPYLQYAYARTRAILERANTTGIKIELDPTAAPSELTRLLVRFPEIVARATVEYEPHYLATYLIAVAGAYNSWYSQVQILDQGAEEAHKVAVVEAVSRTLKRGLDLLGIPAPEKM